MLQEQIRSKDFVVVVFVFAARTQRIRLADSDNGLILLVLQRYHMFLLALLALSYVVDVHT